MLLAAALLYADKVDYNESQYELEAKELNSILNLNVTRKTNFFRPDFINNHKDVYDIFNKESSELSTPSPVEVTGGSVKFNPPLDDDTVGSFLDGKGRRLLQS